MAANLEENCRSRTRTHPEGSTRHRRKNVLVIGGAGTSARRYCRNCSTAATGCACSICCCLIRSRSSAMLGHPNLEIVQGDFRHVGKIVEAMQGHRFGRPFGRHRRRSGLRTRSRTDDRSESVGNADGGRGRQTCAVSNVSCLPALARSTGLATKSSTNVRPRSPVSHYGNTKLAAERVLRQMADDRFAPTILRFATIYGLSGRTRFDLVVNLLTAKAKIDGQDYRQRRKPMAAVRARRRCGAGDCHGVGSADGNWLGMKFSTSAATSKTTRFGKSAKSFINTCRVRN